MLRTHLFRAPEVAIIAALPFASWSLKTKFALCCGALMFATSLAFTSWTLTALEADVRSGVTASQLALARATASDIDAKVEQRRAALLQVASLLSTTRPAPGAPTDAFFATSPLLASLFDALFMVDADGRIVFDAPRVPGRIGSSLADRDAVHQALGGAPMTISSPVAMRLTGEPAIVFATPLRGADGRIEGALLGRIELNRPNFLGALGEQRIGREGFFTIIENSPNPIFVMHGHKDRILKPATDAKRDPRLAPALAGEQGSLQRTNSLGVETLSCFVPLHAVPWVLFTVFPTSEAFAQLHLRRQEVVGVGIALFLLAAGMAWLMSGWLLRPLSELHTAINRQAHDPDHAMSPQRAGSAELAAVVTAYNAQTARRRDVEARLAASEARMAAVTDNIPAFIAHFDTHQCCTFVNAQVGTMFGRAAKALRGQPLRQVVGDAVHAQIEPQVARVLAAEAPKFETAGTAAGRHRHHQWSLVPDLAEVGPVRGFFALAFDITSLDEARARQAQVEQQLRAITDNLPVLISYVDRNERYAFLNATFETWLGIDPDRATGGPVGLVSDPSHRIGLRARLRRGLQGERLSFESEIDTLEGRKTLHTVFVPDRGPDGDVAGLYSLSSDVTALRDAERQLSRLVRSDALTGLANRYNFNETLPQAMALLFLDIDHFKQINDTLGHAGSDEALKELARRLQRNVRSTDLVARLAGDEFVVILEGLHSEVEAERVASKMIADVDQPFEIEGRPHRVTVSVGVAHHAGADIDAADLLARADAALYAAKAAGRNNYRMAASA